MTDSINNLVKRCQDVFEGSGAAVSWIDDTRQSSQRLDREGEPMIETLRRHRNMVRRLGEAAQRPLSVGFFGVSQAGKSYLISSLAVDESGELETNLGAERLNFIKHINPPGGGKEATGLVTRFTRRASRAPASHPVDVKLLSEGDVIKILGNSFYSDFDSEKVENDITSETIHSRLVELERKRQPKPTGGLDEDDMVDVMDYFRRRFKNSMEIFQGEFWPTAVDLAPRLLAADRAQLMSLLWGGIDPLTQAYLRLSEALAKIGNASEAYCALNVLVEKIDSGYSQEHGIVNVDILSRMGCSDDDMVELLPVCGGEVLGAQSISRATLAALVAELNFVLAEKPRAELLENVDLLDFPGYRGRLRVGSFEEVAKAADKSGQTDPVAALILRGKVAYLFERYIEDQEMNILVLCTPSDKQSEIETVSQAVDAWVKNTQGETPEERAARLPGLIWAFTRLDIKMLKKPSDSPEMRRKEWDGMVQMVLERFQSSDWLSNWAGGQPFRNMFLVRKPGMADALIETSPGGQESGIRTEAVDHMAMLRESFVTVEGVQTYFADPGNAWDAMINMNDGGMNRIAEYLNQVALPQSKIERIGEQVDKITTSVVARELGPFYFGEGEGEVAKKRDNAAQVQGNLKQRLHHFGEFLACLQPNDDHLRSLYLYTQSHQEAGADDAGAAASGGEPHVGGGLISLDLSGTAPAEAEASGGKGAGAISQNKAYGFAEALMKDWYRHLRQLSDDPTVQRYIGITTDTMNKVVDEVVTGAERNRVLEQVADALNEAENRAGVSRSQLVDQQVKVASSIINNFIDYLGLNTMSVDNRPSSKAGGGRRTFENPKLIDGLPNLPDQPINYPAMYILDWLDGFEKMAIDNVGHTAGRDISPEQNERLGAILNKVRGQAVAHEGLA